MIIFFIVLFITIFLFFLSLKRKESFESRCIQFNECKTCAQASGCSWCPKAKTCLPSTSLKSTDKECNQMNTITSDFRCKAESESIGQERSPIDAQFDFTLYKDRIKNKLPPPNAYISGKVEYSSSDLTSNMNEIRNTVNNLTLGLPGIISSSVENEIKPMVKGIIQEGFAEYKASCQSRKTCDNCTDSTECGWNPLTLKCENRGANKAQFITQKQRCIITPSTLKLMRTQTN